MDEVILDFDAEDNPLVSVRGVKGRRCKDLTRQLETVLGKVESDRVTAEYREEEQQDERRRVGNQR